MTRGTGSAPELYGGFSSVQTAGKIHAEFMALVTSSSMSSFGITDTSPYSTGVSAWLLTSTTNADVNFFAAGNYDDTGVDYISGVWQKWEIDLDLDSDTYTVTVDGSKSGTITVEHADRDAAYFIARVSAKGGQHYIDAVPEPATITLLGLCGLCLAGYCYLRKRRRA